MSGLMNFLAAGGAEAGIFGQRTAARGAIALFAETPVQGIGFFAVLHDVHDGMAVFGGGVAEVIDRGCDGLDDEHDAKQRKREGRAVG